MRQAKAIYSELVIAMELVTITCILAKTQSHVKEWESFIVKKGKLWVCCLDREAVGRLT